MNPRWLAPLLGEGEPPAFRVLGAGRKARVVVVCDHASNLVPRALADLGLSVRELDSHIAWDPGAAHIARRLSVLIDAPLIETSYSRLVIDCNRPPESAESIPSESAGTRVPGNAALTADERELRIATLFRPYHDAIEVLLTQRAPLALLSIHTFTPSLGGHARPWHVGVASGSDRRLADPLLRSLSGDPALEVGDNHPYAIERGIDYTIPAHAEDRGLPGALVEIRQDCASSEAQARDWAERLAVAYGCFEQDSR